VPLSISSISPRCHPQTADKDIQVCAVEITIRSLYSQCTTDSLAPCSVGESQDLRILAAPCCRKRFQSMDVHDEVRKPSQVRVPLGDVLNYAAVQLHGITEPQLWCPGLSGGKTRSRCLRAYEGSRTFYAQCRRHIQSLTP
jgi:hypothetical protein